MYPYDFEAELEARLSEMALRLALRVRNLSRLTLPLAPGLHPYFAVPSGGWPNLHTNIQGFDAANYGLGETLLAKEFVDHFLTEVQKFSHLRHGHPGFFLCIHFIQFIQNILAGQGLLKRKVSPFARGNKRKFSGSRIANPHGAVINEQATLMIKVF
jgi:hypothetical protein